MPLPPRPVDSTLHDVVDYTAGATLLSVFPKLAGVEGTRSARQIRAAGAIHAGYSALTDYPVGLIEAIPYHDDVDAVRRANAEDPRRKIHDGTPAVRPAAAAT
jgi:hypothetical protein